MTGLERETFAAQTSRARAEVLLKAPAQISQASRNTLSYLLHGDRSQQEPGAA